jgi:hypothetical protein
MTVLVATGGDRTGAVGGRPPRRECRSSRICQTVFTQSRTHKKIVAQKQQLNQIDTLDLKTLKIPWEQSRGGSSPTVRTSSVEQRNATRRGDEVSWNAGRRTSDRSSRRVRGPAAAPSHVQRAADCRQVKAKYLGGDCVDDAVETVTRLRSAKTVIASSAPEGGRRGLRGGRVCDT